MTVATAFDRELGAKLRYYRTLQGLTQDELAQRLGLTFQQVQKYEKGVNRIAVSRLVDIAKVLQMPVTAFFDPLASQLPSPTEDQSMVAMVKTFSRIDSRRVRSALIQLAKAMGTGGEDATLPA